MLKDPTKNQECATGCDRAPKWMNGKFCLSVLEKYEDHTIPVPNSQPYLDSFTYASGGGAAFCSPVWYAFRYVRNKDGGYGPLSAWSGTPEGGTVSVIDPPMAIYSCALELPTIPGDTSVPLGNLTSTFNKPTVAIIKPLNLDVKTGQEDGYTLNVHRQVGSIQNGTPVFDPEIEGDVIGSFFVYATPKKGSAPIYAEFPDGVFHPNPKSTQTRCC